MKQILIVASALLLLSSQAEAYYPQGMKVYKKMCITCQGSPFRGAKMHTVMEWEDIRDASPTPTLKVHEGQEEALNLLHEGYFTKKREADLYKFLIGNAKDSGAVPGCDGNYCGSTN